MTSLTKQHVQPTEKINGILDFDYASVPTSVANFLRGQATRIRHCAAKSIIQIGKDLAAAKHYLSHGQFLRWVESEIGIPARTAQAYMHASQWASNKRSTVALLPPSLLYLLSAQGTPTEFTDQVLKRVEAGEQIPPATVRAELKALRAARHNSQGTKPPTSIVSLGGDDTDLSRGISSCEAALTQAVSILTRGLSKSDFAQFCEIMTSRKVLEHPELSERLKIAFFAADQITFENRRPTDDGKLNRRAVAKNHGGLARQ